MNATEALRWMAQRIDADPKATRRGVVEVRTTPAMWEELGCPTSIELLDGTRVPFLNTGRKPNWFSWRYRRLRPRARR